jgi:lipid-A-disaccharide synthase-like uncharacterized protein
MAHWTLGAWLAVGFLGQLLFTARFVVQWAVSEKKRESIVPVAFWWLSLLGGGTLLLYAIHRRDPVFVAGQAMGFVVYVRNLMLLDKAKRRMDRRTIRAATPNATMLSTSRGAPIG